MKQLFASLLFVLAGFPSLAQKMELSLRDIPAIVLAKDLAIDAATQSARLAHDQYLGVLSQRLPQLDLKPGYSLHYTPSQQTQPFVLTTTPPYLSVEEQTNTNQGISNVSAGLFFSQLLPTAGSLSLSLEHEMTVYTYGSQQIVSPGPTTSIGHPAPQFSQQPKIGFEIDQPLFVNGKVIDSEIYPATIQQARIAYQKADLNTRAQVNETIFQAAQYFLQIVQLRKTIEQMEKAMAVSRGNLETLKKNFSLGSVAEANVLDASIALSNQKGGLLEVRAALAKTEMALAHSSGRHGFQAISFADNIPTIAFRMSKDEALAKAMSNHPLLRRMSLDSEEKKVAALLADRSYASELSLAFWWEPRYPFVNSTTPYMTDFTRSFSNLFTAGSGADFTVSATLSLQLLDGRKRKAERAGNAASIKIAQDALQARKQAIWENVEIGFLQKANLEEKISTLAEAINLAKKRLDSETILRDLGKSTDLNVDCKRADYDTKVNDLWRARADLFLTVIDLCALTGENLAQIMQEPGSGMPSISHH